MRIETGRLYLREMTAADYEALYAVLADSDIMQHYPYTFDEARVRGWIDRNIERYSVFGFGLWAVCLHENGEMIGDCGLTMQLINGQIKPEIGCHIRKDMQRRGYAKESASAVRDWAFCNTPFNAIIHESGEPAVMPHRGKLGLYPGRRVRRRGERAYKGVRHHT